MSKTIEIIEKDENGHITKNKITEITYQKLKKRKYRITESYTEKFNEEGIMYFRQTILTYNMVKD